MILENIQSSFLILNVSFQEESEESIVDNRSVKDFLTWTHWPRANM